MNISGSSRRLIKSAASFRPHSPFYPFFLCQHHRTLFDGFLRGRKKKQDIIDPSSPEFQQRETVATAPPPQLRSGKLAPSSIFDATPTSEHPEAEGQAIGPPKRVYEPTPSDPQPKARLRWQRKMVIRDIRGRHRLNKTEKVLRSERYHLAKSHFMPTSIKKLGPLARQIAGKPLNEAMVQMRFSKKKAAADLLKHLEYARSQAVVVKGMGMGQVGVGKEGTGKVEKQHEEGSLMSEDKKGKKRKVTDRSAMYIDEAWVGRGKYQKTKLDYRAKGQANRLMTPFTSISVVLKEEATRIRQAEEREQKRQRKKVWVPLPDRPVTAQRQYPLW